MQVMKTQLFQEEILVVKGPWPWGGGCEESFPPSEAISEAI